MERVFAALIWTTNELNDTFENKMLLDGEISTQIQAFNPNTSGNAPQAFFLTSACPDSQRFAQLSQNP